MEKLFLDIKEIVNKDIPLISNLANVSSLLNKLVDINWVGFYILNDN